MSKQIGPGKRYLKLNIYGTSCTYMLTGKTIKPTAALYFCKVSLLLENREVYPVQAIIGCNA